MSPLHFGLDVFGQSEARVQEFDMVAQFHNYPIISMGTNVCPICKTLALNGHIKPRIQQCHLLADPTIL
jgi:hypothetical protein